MDFIVWIVTGAFEFWWYALKFVFWFFGVMLSPVWLLFLVDAISDKHMEHLMKKSEDELETFLNKKTYGKNISPTVECFDGSTKTIITDVPNNWSAFDELQTQQNK